MRSLDHSSSRGRIAAIPRSYGPEAEIQVYLFDDASYAQLSRTTLPSFSTPTRTVGSHGLFVFFSNDGSELYALVEALPSPPLSARFGLVRMPVTQ